MGEALRWSPGFSPVILVLATELVLLPVHCFAGSIASFRCLLSRLGKGARAQQIWGVLLQRFCGALLLGAVPAAVAAAGLGLSPASLGLNLHGLRTSLLVAMAGVALLLPVGLMLRRFPVVFGAYPEIRLPHWGPSLLAINGASWAVYLAAYELLFRGFLLFPLAAALGSWPAILITTGLYAHHHLIKGPIEAFTTIPTGIVYGMVALSTGSILGPFLVHLFIAFTSEVLAISSRTGYTLQLSDPPTDAAARN